MSQLRDSDTGLDHWINLRAKWALPRGLALLGASRPEGEEREKKKKRGKNKEKK